MKKYLLIFILIFSFLYTQESSENNSLNIADFYDDRFDVSILHLDYNHIYKSSFLLDKYFPNHLIDYNLYGLTLNGGTNAPLYQMIPEKIYFNIKEPGRMSQLTYKEKKMYDYFNTKIVLKADLSEELRFLGFAESKSFYGNINQNYLLNTYKTTDNGFFEISYMYHIDEAPIDYMNDNAIGNTNCNPQNYFGVYYEGDTPNTSCEFKSFNKLNESFNFGAKFSHTFNKIKFYHNTSYQVTETINIFDDNQDDLDYAEAIKWYNNSLEYNLNKRGILVFKHNYKNTVLENYKELADLESYQSESSIGILYDFFDNITLKLFFDILTYDNTNKSLPNIEINYKKQRYSLSVGKENDIMSNFYEKNTPSLYYYYTERQYIKGDINLNKFSTNLELGDIKINYFDNAHPYFMNQSGALFDMKYNYLLTKGSYNHKWFSLEYNYKFYDSDFTYINEHLALGVAVSPKIKNVRYRPFTKINFNSFTINSIYEIDLKSSSLFDFDLSMISSEDRIVNSLNMELGLIFKSFKISYTIYNPFNDKYSNEVQYSNKLLPEIGKYSHINVIWIFKE